MTDRVDKIGKVRLNLRWYRGEDRYSDGDDTENRLLSIVEENAPDAYNDIIMREGSWPLLYHLSPIRENIIAWYPFRRGASVLELGAGCGAVTGALLNRGLDVCAVDLSLRRSRINATRHADCGELEICVGAIEDVLAGIGRQFDYVLLIGVLEYAAVFSDAPEPQRRMLDCIRRVMKPDAALFVAIENKLGLKYLAGCREDHTGRFFESIEGYPHRDGPRTFSRRELERLFANCGFHSRFYYPYPDYKFPMKVFTDAMPPARGELNRNWQSFDADRVYLFDEGLAADTLIDAGLMPEFANSFLAELTLAPARGGESVRFVKSSMERRPPYRHHTLIMETGEGILVRKKAASRGAEAHLRHMGECHDRLVAGLLPGARIGILPCRLNPDGAIDFEYCDRSTLRDRLAALHGDIPAFCDEILRFRDCLIAGFGAVPFERAPGFDEVFGAIDPGPGARCLGVTNLDLNFDNVFIDGDIYRIADYEWVMPFPVPLDFMLYRALLVNADMGGFSDSDRGAVWTALGLNPARRETLYAMELAFQSFVSGENDKLERFKNAALDPDSASLGMDEMSLAGKYHRINDALWERVGLAERDVENLKAGVSNLEAELEVWRRRAPFWYKLADKIRSRRRGS